MVSVLEWTTTKRGFDSLLLDGYVYKQCSYKFKDNSSKWNCVKTKVNIFEDPENINSSIKTKACPGSIKLSDLKVVVKNNSARHICNTQPKEAVKRKAQENVRKLAIASVSTPSAIFNKTLRLSPKSERETIFAEKMNLQKVASRKKVATKLYQDEPKSLEEIKFTGKNL
jgi:hypothetical protein